MKGFKDVRERAGLSQRRLAALARVSYKTVQLFESGRHDPQLSTIEAIARALGHPVASVTRRIEALLKQPVDSIAAISERLALETGVSWKIVLFDFVDAFRRTPARHYIDAPPADMLAPRLRALLASTVDALCEEQHCVPPWWCDGVPCLPEPWFVAELESLKAIAVAESPVHFRKRNIFVLGNFLERR